MARPADIVRKLRVRMNHVSAASWTRRLWRGLMTFPELETVAWALGIPLNLKFETLKLARRARTRQASINLAAVRW